ncbi:peptidoglycan synthetase [Marivirga sp. S37H4]|uniref:Peptidoglycan synthetase n=1 Tax=Marivirga aurantiaca TaxID=2802615 RepID=A0A934WWH4_9BACT|nr:Mur ligase domain-containing protein [Marivirga aurantiaca]MBK6264165.1 peptidoglycan synthetase [Marivirga aurantiaca]
MNLENIKKVHFIAIGGSVMHNLALALHQKGIQVSGSDDEIYEPAASKLAKAGIKPEAGWHPEQITPELDAIILGMHAQKDNPELLKARELGLNIYSFPEFIKKLSENKQRIVIGGSHGKSTITSMIMHVLKHAGKPFDYLVGAELEGFDLTVSISSAPIIVIEGDEYLSSKIDPVPKFLKYDHHIGVISGIEWDHKNVFPTMDDYTQQFDEFADKTPKAGSLIYCEEDALANIVGSKEREDVRKSPYSAHNSKIVDGKTILVTKDHGNVPIKIFGKHNLQNISAAFEVCKLIGIKVNTFYEAIASFKGAANRLTLLDEANGHLVYKDYAHAPSKLVATVDAMHHQFPDKKLCVAYELHTFSSLDPDYLKQYKGTLKNCDQAFIYVNPANLKLKDGKPFTEEDLRKAFDQNDLKYFDDTDQLVNAMLTFKKSHAQCAFAFLSSGHFNHINFKTIAHELVS